MDQKGYIMDQKGLKICKGKKYSFFSLAEFFVAELGRCSLFDGNNLVSSILRLF